MSRLNVATFYRIVQTNPPTLGDFLSDKDQGRPVRSGTHRHFWDGISVYATEQQARRKVQDYPFLGSFIAQLEIPDQASLRIERTLRRSRGHHTLWGDSAYLLRCVVSVIPV